MSNINSVDRAKNKEKNVTSSMLRDKLNYNPDTGELTWAIKSGPRRGGGRAGSIMKTGYIEIGILGYRMKAHRVCWCIHHGSWPSHMIDHINGDRADNRICNLREASNGQNMCNVGALANNSSGIKGVYFCKQTGMWCAEISIEGRKIWLGRHRSIEKAEQVRLDATDKYHKEFAFKG